MPKALYGALSSLITHRTFRCGREVKSSLVLLPSCRAHVEFFDALGTDPTQEPRHFRCTSRVERLEIEPPDTSFNIPPIAYPLSASITNTQQGHRRTEKDLAKPDALLDLCDARHEPAGTFEGVLDLLEIGGNAIVEGIEATLKAFHPAVKLVHTPVERVYAAIERIYAAAQVLLDRVDFPRELHAHVCEVALCGGFIF